MPLYKYECNDCNEVFEELVIGSNENVNCPKCVSANVTRQVSLISSKGLSSDSSSCSVSQHSCGPT